MRKTFLPTLFVTILLIFSSCEVLNNLPLAPSNFEVISALKEVLNSSAFRAIKAFEDVNKNGAAALLPKEMEPVLATLKTIGLGSKIDKVEKQMIDISGAVVSESKEIMTDAIKEVSFADAVSVVTGGENAATMVLKNAMYATVKKRYSSQLDGKLKNTDANKYWPMAAGAYNIFAKDKVDNSLSDFMAERAVDVLFTSMGKQEKEIRDNPSSLGKQVVTKVFDYYSDKK